MIKALAEVSAGDEFSFSADEGGIVDAEHHGQRGRLDLRCFQGQGIQRIADAVGDVYGFEADERDDVARLGFLDVLAAKAVEDLNLLDFAFDLCAIAAADRDLLAGFDLAVVDATDADAADVVVVENAADLDLQGFIEIAVRRGDVLQQRFEDGENVRARLLKLPGRGTGPAAGVEDREIEGLVVGAQFDEEVEYFIEHGMGPGVGAVDFVDDDDRAKLVLECFFENEAGLGHRALGGVHQEEHAVGHAENAFDFAAEVGVAGGVDEVDLDGLAVGAGVIDGDVFGQNGDSAFAFEGIAVEEGVLLDLAVAEISALTQQGIDQSRFAMVNVSDDCDITDVVTHLIHVRSRFKVSRGRCLCLAKAGGVTPPPHILFFNIGRRRSLPSFASPCASARGRL